MTIKSANPNTLRTILAGAQPGDTIALEPGLYEGSYGTPTAGNPGRPITVAGATTSQIASRPQPVARMTERLC